MISVPDFTYVGQTAFGYAPGEIEEKHGWWRQRVHADDLGKVCWGCRSGSRWRAESCALSRRAAAVRLCGCEFPRAKADTEDARSCAAGVR